MADEIQNKDDEAHAALIASFYAVTPKVPPAASPISIRPPRRSRWAPLAAGVASVSMPFVGAAWGWLTWSNVDRFGHIDNAPRRACALFLLLSPIFLGVATLYFFSAGAILRRLRVPPFRGLTAMSVWISAAWGTLASMHDPFGQHLLSFAVVACDALVPLASGSIVYWWFVRLRRQ